MAEQVMGVVSAEVDQTNQRIVQKGTLGAETSGASARKVVISWSMRDATGRARFIEEQPRTLAERLDEAYKDELTPEEKGLLDRAAGQLGRRLSGQE